MIDLDTEIPLTPEEEEVIKTVYPDPLECEHKDRGFEEDYAFGRTVRYVVCYDCGKSVVID